MSKSDEMKLLLNEKEEVRELLFPKGFLLTDDNRIDTTAHPFYGLWKKMDFCGYSFYIHPRQQLYTVANEDVGFALVGHAFNPISIQSEEINLLENSIKYYEESEIAFTEYFNQWTGVFALFIFGKDGIRIYGDAAGMYTVFYGTYCDKVYCSSHTNLLGDICNLKFDSYITRLINYRFYPLFGKQLPGDLSPYTDFKRLIPNHFVQCNNKEWSVARFFPTEKVSLCDLPYEEIVKQAANILCESMNLIHKKWQRCAISLTGGCDSKTTLSCTKDAYNKYSYFSYVSSDSEAVDAEAAAKICKMLGLEHKIYKISDCDEDYEEIQVIKEIMEYNSGNVGRDNPNDVRKRAFFLRYNEFDVEVKSWVSEVARAYYHKRFLKKKFPKRLTPRYATTLYKVFVTDRKLVRDTDKVFAEFLHEYYETSDFERVSWWDLFFWEFRMSSWNGLVITGEHQIAYDITIPYNNRTLLQLMLSTPMEYRIKDKVHKDIVKKMNIAISECRVSVVNVKHTAMRAKLERMYLSVFSKLPF